MRTALPDDICSQTDKHVILLTWRPLKNIATMCIWRAAYDAIIHITRAKIRQGHQSARQKYLEVANSALALPLHKRLHLKEHQVAPPCKGILWHTNEHVLLPCSKTAQSYRAHSDIGCFCFFVCPWLHGGLYIVTYIYVGREGKQR